MRLNFKVLAPIAAIALLAAACNQSAAPAPSQDSAPQANQNSQQDSQQNAQPAPQAAAVKNFTVNANDESADLTTISVNKGDTVNITFNVLANQTYHGGLDFRSANLSSGTIAPGDSKTLSFTATDSFTFTPYWPASNIKKPYTVAVVVK